MKSSNPPTSKETVSFRTDISEFSDIAPQASRAERIRRIWVSLVNARTPLLGLVVIVVVFLVAFLAPVIAPYDPEVQELSLRLMPPAWVNGGEISHLLGTDQLGRDILSRLNFRYSDLSFSRFCYGWH